MSPIDWDKAHFLIACVGMADAWMWSFEADNKWTVIHGTPGAGLVPFRSDGSAPATFEEVLFLADCVAFDHDMPTVVRPSASIAAAAFPPIEPVLPSPAGQGALWYFDALQQALGMATEMRVGDAVALRYDDDHQDLLQFEQRFGGVEEVVSLYAMATRQVDALGEYLCLYRVLEWARKDNGTSYIETHLGAISGYDFGVLEAQPGMGAPSVDVFETYQSRARARLNALHDRGLTDQQIASRLYGIRNSLAHGKRAFRVNDFGADVVAVAADLPLIKLLARMVVEKT